MNFYPKIVRSIFLPTMDFFKRTQISKSIDFFTKSQYWSYEKLLDYQTKELRKLIKHVYQEVPYYHNYMKKKGLYPDDIKKPEDLKHFPIITKEDIRAAPKSFQARDMNIYHPIEFRTSGTSGTPFKYFLDRYRWSRDQAVMYRDFSVGKYAMGQKRAVFTGIHKTQKLRERAQDFILRKKSFSCLQLSDDIIRHYINEINKFKPVMFIGYSSALEAIADYVIHNDVEISSPKVIFTVAEKLYDFQRDKLQKAFSSDIFEGYGGSDVGVFTLDCEHHNRHICIETGIMEFLDEKDRTNVAIGERGELVTTMLNNYSQAFIRYSPGDLGVPIDDVCTCYRGYPLMGEVIGRVLDSFTFSNGITVYPTAFPGRDFSCLKQFQMIQEKRDKVLIKAVKNKSFVESDTEKLLNTVKSCCGKGVNVEIEFVEEIPLTGSGKRKFWISRV